MAAEERVSPFPLPPSDYYKLYTDENIKAMIAPEPPPPIRGEYSVFGLQFETDEPIIRSLEQQNMDRLYPLEFNRQKELKKLNHSVLINFLELLDILINEPTSPKREKKLGEITVLFINMHHLINELRPHQARETLRVMMERQKQQRLETADKLDKLVDKVLSLVQSCSISLQSDPANVNNITMKHDSSDKESNKTPNLIEESELHTLCDMVEDLT
ncbi:Mediator of RNA polymerase II transcription subunit 7 [Paramuricea clavata]|uniref:Mediator of RNA polymerase II transcription subunit 7 n=1 Tax=Paramuricea clavata TaxID=317549 RepID=A0A7D9E8M5_PARCT|nr:Mediator of RNA polymerase II transcription subunit 7 [Paramuricea clavata]